MTEGDLDLKWKCIECRSSPSYSKVDEEKVIKDEVEKVLKNYRPTARASAFIVDYNENDPINADSDVSEDEVKKVPKNHRLTSRASSFMVDYNEKDSINTESDDSDDAMDFEGFEKNPAYPCVYCKLDVSGRQHALSCTVCNRWQHRKCHSGIDYDVYRRMMEGASNLKWKCWQCQHSSIYSKVGVETVTKSGVEKLSKTRRPTTRVSKNLEKHNNDIIQIRENNYITYDHTTSDHSYCKRIITDNHTVKDHSNADSDDSEHFMDFEGFENGKIGENLINTDGNHPILESYMNNEESQNNDINNIVDNNNIETDLINTDSDKELDIDCILTQLNELPCKPGEQCTCTTDFTSQVPKYILDLFTIMPENRVIIVDDDEVICL